MRASGLDWTILRPGYLNDGPPTGHLLAVPTDYPQNFSSKVVRADVSAYALDAVSDPTTIRRELMLVAPKQG